MTKWWAALPERERKLLKITGVIIVAFIYWLAVWRPLSMGAAGNAARVEGLRLDTAYIQAAAQEAVLLRQQPVTTGNRGNLSLLALAEQSSRAAGLGAAFRRGEPVGESGARIWLESAVFDDVVGWMGLLETRYGVVVDEASIERTGSSGLVNASLLLSE